MAHAELNINITFDIGIRVINSKIYIIQKFQIEIVNEGNLLNSMLRGPLGMTMHLPNSKVKLFHLPNHLG